MLSHPLNPNPRPPHAEHPHTPPSLYKLIISGNIVNFIINQNRSRRAQVRIGNANLPDKGGVIFILHGRYYIIKKMEGVS